MRLIALIANGKNRNRIARPKNRNRNPWSFCWIFESFCWKIIQQNDSEWKFSKIVFSKMTRTRKIIYYTCQFHVNSKANINSNSKLFRLELTQFQFQFRWAYSIPNYQKIKYLNSLVTLQLLQQLRMPNFGRSKP